VPKGDIRPKLEPDANCPKWQKQTCQGRERLLAFPDCSAAGLLEVPGAQQPERVQRIGLL
jgi:hypothetical protein